MKRHVVVAVAAAVAVAPVAVAPVVTASCAACRDSLPSGSYAASCEDCSMDCATLVCRCANTNGQLLDAELDVSGCEDGDDVWNDHGVLKCGGGASCIPNGYACGPSGAAVSACCSGYCGETGTCK